MKGAVRCMAALALLTCGSALLATPAADPFVGTWILNVEKSTYPPGTYPKSMVIEMETLEGGGVRYRSATVYSNGATSTARYAAKYDGQEVPVQGSRRLLLPVSLKRLDANTVVAAYKRGFRVVATSRREVSRDGRTMTITTTSPNQAGKNVTIVGVYQKKPLQARPGQGK